MPRRPLYPAKGLPILERIKQMLVDRRTWTTMFYFLLMLPLGILYFVIATVGISVSIGLVGGAIASVLFAAGIGGGSISLEDHAVYFGPSPLAAPFLLIGGVLLLTAVMHLIRGIGRGHGTLAKHLLVARADAD
jgi:Putative sensor